MPDRSVSLTLEPGGFPTSDDAARPQTSVPSETANQWTHGLGFVLSLGAAAVMVNAVWSQPDMLRTAGCLIYLATLVGLYAASTLSHSFEDPARRSFYRTLDQVCIFLLAAGSFTPFAMTHLRGGWGWGVFLAMWGLACVGIVVRLLRGEGAVAFLFYVLLGWMPVLTLGRVFDLGGSHGLALVIGGGLAYTGGLWFLVNDGRHRYLHAAWHLCTITGSACHFLFLQWYVAEWPVV